MYITVSLGILRIAMTIVKEMLVNPLRGVGCPELAIWIWELKSQDLGRNEWISEQVCRLLRNENEDKIEESGDSGEVKSSGFDWGRGGGVGGGEGGGRRWDLFLVRSFFQEFLTYQPCHEIKFLLSTRSLTIRMF